MFLCPLVQWRGLRAARRRTANSVGALAPSKPRRSAPIEIACETRFWAMGGERCAQSPPRLVTDQPDATAVVPPNHLDSPLQPVKRAVRQPASGEDAAQPRPVANPPQPCRDDSERLIAGEETRHEHDGTTVARGTPTPYRRGRPAGGRVRATVESRPAGGPSSASGPARRRTRSGRRARSRHGPRSPP